MFNFLDTEFVKDPMHCKNLVRLSKDQVVVLITHLLTDQALSFSNDTLSAMIYFI
jgi:hypothetical protein